MKKKDYNRWVLKTMSSLGDVPYLQNYWIKHWMKSVTWDVDIYQSEHRVWAEIAILASEVTDEIFYCP